MYIILEKNIIQKNKTLKILYDNEILNTISFRDFLHVVAYGWIYKALLMVFNWKKIKFKNYYEMISFLLF